jgi:hypothetical protein
MKLLEGIRRGWPLMGKGLRKNKKSSSQREVGERESFMCRVL